MVPVRSIRKAVLGLAIAAMATCVLSACREAPHESAALAPFTLETRPQTGRFLFDYAAVLSHSEEGTHAYLERIASRYQIEALVVSLPSLPKGHVVETLALDLVAGWRVGGEHAGRGLLLLLVDDTKQVKLEVGYALEDVFTDGFAGYVEDLQLGPAYRSDEIGVGLLAVMEMFEARAQLKYRGDYMPDEIARLDSGLLSGGAGATRSLERYARRELEASAPRPAGPGARSPEEAWKTLLAQWSRDETAPGLDVYTEMTRQAMGDPTRVDPRTRKWLAHWKTADYQVRRDGDHAVIWFGAIDGWENSPFLFCDTGEGWRFDIVHQRRLVVMAEAPRWQVAQGPYPYVSLMKEAWQSTAKDLPLAEADLYRCQDDAAWAARMGALEAALERNVEDVEATLELMRLRVITGQRPKRVRPLIERGKTMAPMRAEPWKYSAIYNVNSFFQNRTAMADIDRYIELAPQDPFGPAMKGFLHYRLGEYLDSIEALERAAELDPESAYAWALMARDYALLIRGASDADGQRYRERAREMRMRAEHAAEPDPQRIARLDGWLARRL